MVTTEGLIKVDALGILKMPIMEILGQTIYYNPTPLERTLEKSLERYGLNLPEIKIEDVFKTGDPDDHFPEEVSRKLSVGKSRILYLKCFENQRKGYFLKDFKDSRGEVKFYLDVPKLLKVLNTARFGEKIRLFYKDVIDKLELRKNKPNNNQTLSIAFKNRKGVSWFAIMLHNYCGANISENELIEKLGTPSITNLELRRIFGETDPEREQSIKNLNKIIKEIDPRVRLFNQKDYIDIMVDYFALREGIKTKATD